MLLTARYVIGEDALTRASSNPGTTGFSRVEVPSTTLFATVPLPAQDGTERR
jgi:hypothetical protein